MARPRLTSFWIRGEPRPRVLCQSRSPTAPYCIDEIRVTAIYCILAACNALALTGLCCPGPEGSYLACCDSPGGPPRMNDEWRALLFIDHAGDHVTAPSAATLDETYVLWCSLCSGRPRNSLEPDPDPGRRWQRELQS